MTMDGMINYDIDGNEEQQRQMFEKVFEQLGSEEMLDEEDELPEMENVA